MFLTFLDEYSQNYFTIREIINPMKTSLKVFKGPINCTCTTLWTKEVSYHSILQIEF